MKHIFKRDKCRLCDESELELALKLTPTPIAGSYVCEEHLNESIHQYPLNLYLCNKCGHLQLLDVIDTKSLNNNFTYVSSSTIGLQSHFKKYANEIINYAGLQRKSNIACIGSNDGLILKFYKKRGMRVLGIETEKHLAHHASDQGINTIPSVFNYNLAREILSDWGSADVIIAGSAHMIFANVDDLRGMVKGIKKLLARHGIFVFEVGYLLDIVQKNNFTNIYHEHLSYHSVSPLYKFFYNHGMEIINIERNPIKGGSIRVIVQKRNGPYRFMPIVERLICIEEKLKLNKIQTYRALGQRLIRIKEKLNNILNKIEKGGKSIVGFGASPSSTTLIYHFGLGTKLQFLIDDNPKKHNHFSPGYHIQVLPSSSLYTLRPDYVIILAWIYSKTIIKNHYMYLKQGGHFILPLPTIKIL